MVFDATSGNSTTKNQIGFGLKKTSAPPPPPTPPGPSPTPPGPSPTPPGPSPRPPDPTPDPSPDPTPDPMFPDGDITKHHLFLPVCAGILSLILLILLTVICCRKRSKHNMDKTFSR